MDFRARRSNLTEQVGQLLQQYIIKNKLQPGDELPTEMELAELFGVSRTVIREGLSAVSAIGVIETVSGRRARVAKLSGVVLNHFFSNAVRLNTKSITELLGVREALEIYAVQLAAKNNHPDMLRNLKAQLAIMEATLTSDTDAFIDADIEFHSCLAKMSGNSMLFYLITELRSATRETISSGLRAQADSLAAINEVHKELYAAVKAREPKQALQAMTLHFEKAIAALQASELLVNDRAQVAR